MASNRANQNWPASEAYEITEQMHDALRIRTVELTSAYDALPSVEQIRALLHVDTCIYCGVKLQPNGDGVAHENGLVSCRPQATRATSRYQFNHKNWVPWQLSPDSDPQERWILVNAADDGEEHPSNRIFETLKDALAYADADSRSLADLAQSGDWPD